MDPHEFELDREYRFDEAEYIRQFLPIKDNIIGTIHCRLREPDWPWAKGIQYIASLDLPLSFIFNDAGLRPKPLIQGEVSIALKHKTAWQEIAKGSSEFAIIAEDDIIVSNESFRYLEWILSSLPGDFDYIDIGGGLGLTPRSGNRCVNSYFYEIDPPRSRTACCAIVRKRFVQRILEIDLPLALGVDWTLILLFYLTNAKVYWTEPLVFGHGSQMHIYPSSLLVEGHGTG